MQGQAGVCPASPGFPVLRREPGPTRTFRCHRGQVGTVPWEEGGLCGSASRFGTGDSGRPAPRSRAAGAASVLADKPQPGSKEETLVLARPGEGCHASVLRVDPSLQGTTALSLCPSTVNSLRRAEPVHRGPQRSLRTLRLTRDCLFLY